MLWELTGRLEGEDLSGSSGVEMEEGVQPVEGPDLQVDREKRRGLHGGPCRVIQKTPLGSANNWKLCFKDNRKP